MQTSTDINRSSSQEDTQLIFQESFKGSLDRVDSRTFSGWALLIENEKSRACITLEYEGQVIAQKKAATFRQDLLDAGHGDGCHSYCIEVPAALLKNSNLPTLNIDVYASVTPESERYFIKSVPIVKSGNELLNNTCADLILSSVRDFLLSAQDKNIHKIGHCHNQQYSGGRRNGPVSKLFSSSKSELSHTGKQLVTHSSLKDASKRVADLSNFGSNNPFSEDDHGMSPYLIYTRDRLGLTRLFPIERVPSAKAELLLWYLEHYCTNRSPYRIPLGKREISFANEMLTFPNCKFGISRLHYYMLLSEKSTLPLNTLLNSEDQYRSHVFNWVYTTCTELRCEDAFVPEEYIRYLRSCSTRWVRSGSPLSRYVECLYNLMPEWHVLNLDIEQHRKAVNLLTILHSITNPTSFNFIYQSSYATWMDGSSNEYVGLISSIANWQSNTTSQELQGDTHIVDPKILFDTLELALLAKGYNTHNRQYTSIDQTGNRYEGAKLQINDLDDMCDVQVIGPANVASGLGQATRMSIAMLRSSGLDVNVFNFDMDNPAPVGYNDEVSTNSLKRAKINLLHLNAEALPLAIAYLPDVFSDSYNIGYFFWELDTPARCHNLAIKMLDEIWVSTEFGVRQYTSPTGPVVTNVGMTFEVLDTPCREECRQMMQRDFGIGLTDTVYLTTFDSYSFIQRKNPVAVVKAFQQAFCSETETVKLIIKTQNREAVSDPEQVRLWKELDALIGGDSRIQLINHTMRYSDLLKLKRGSDCYVSLHRSEGWGFGMIEAMGLGVPVIATNYSGNTDFCTDETCWLVDTHEVYLEKYDYIFVEPGQKWGEPSVNSAAACFSDAYNFPEKRQNKASAATSFLSENFSFEVVATKYNRRLEDLLQIENSPSDLKIAS
jgi:glycosyltransferase involved in cell wall biosynthesis